uniref:Candidate secreted effector n=1 Tax=Meloidogyne incognita TaxID=6306 RepID=A0A914N0H2_MELIC
MKYFHKILLAMKKRKTRLNNSQDKRPVNNQDNRIMDKDQGLIKEGVLVNEAHHDKDVDPETISADKGKGKALD